MMYAAARNLSKRHREKPIANCARARALSRVPNDLCTSVHMPHTMCNIYLFMHTHTQTRARTYNSAYIWIELINLCLWRLRERLRRETGREILSSSSSSCMLNISGGGGVCAYCVLFVDKLCEHTHTHTVCSRYIAKGNRLQSHTLAHTQAHKRFLTTSPYRNAIVSWCVCVCTHSMHSRPASPPAFFYIYTPVCTRRRWRRRRVHRII